MFDKNDLFVVWKRNSMNVFNELLLKINYLIPQRREQLCASKINPICFIESNIICYICFLN